MSRWPSTPSVPALASLVALSCTFTPEKSTNDTGYHYTGTAACTTCSNGSYGFIGTVTTPPDTTGDTGTVPPTETGGTGTVDTSGSYHFTGTSASTETGLPAASAPLGQLPLPR